MRRFLIVVRFQLPYCSLNPNVRQVLWGMSPFPQKDIYYLWSGFDEKLGIFPPEISKYKDPFPFSPCLLKSITTNRFASIALHVRGSSPINALLVHPPLALSHRKHTPGGDGVLTVSRIEAAQQRWCQLSFALFSLVIPFCFP